MDLLQVFGIPLLYYVSVFRLLQLTQIGPGGLNLAPRPLYLTPDTLTASVVNKNITHSMYKTCNVTHVVLVSIKLIFTELSALHVIAFRSLHGDLGWD